MVTASNKSSEINPNPQHTGYRHLQYIQSYLAHPWRELHTTIQCTHRVRLRQPSDPRIFKIWCTQRYKLSQHSWSSIKAAFWSKTIQNLMQVTFLLSSQYKGINEWSHLTCHSDSSDCCRQKEELLTRDDCIFGNEAMSVTIFRFHITFFFPLKGCEPLILSRGGQVTPAAPICVFCRHRERKETGSLLSAIEKCYRSFRSSTKNF